MSLRISASGATKRKAAASSPEGSASKRQRVPGPNDDVVETPERTTEEGLKFLDSLMKAQDKTRNGTTDACTHSGRLIATGFLTLPPKDKAPGYYEETVLPIAIDTIEAKLKRKEYPNLSAIEGDVKRMVNNAKQYNKRESALFADAERVRKMLSNYMVKNNPAYKDPNYVAYPTALPDGQSTPSISITGRSASVKISTKGTGTPATDSPAPRGSSTATMDQNSLLDNPDFTGKTFQQAQEQIMEELRKYQEDGLEVYTPFVLLPPRNLVDYYQVIKHPVSLNSVQKRVKGQVGRGAQTGHTDFKSWDAFENEMSFIWRNAREYNEDDSDISTMASQLEAHFKRRLDDAKAKVSEPHHSMIRLKNSAANPTPKQPGTKLRIGGNRRSPSTETPTSGPRHANNQGFTVDSEALRRQQELIQAGVNGQTSEQRPPSRNPFTGSRSGSAAPPIPTISRSQQASSAGSPPLTSNSIKAEAGATSASPGPNGVRAISGAPEARGPSPLANSMPPPATRPHSGSPMPNGHAPLTAPSNPVVHQQPSGQGNSGGLLNRIRDAENPVSKAFLPVLSLSSHPPPLNNMSPPQQNGVRKPNFYLDIPADRTRTQQSLTVALPAHQNHLRITPRISEDVLRNRPYRTFVSLNGAKILPTPKSKLMPEQAGGLVNGEVNAEKDLEEKMQVFEARLIPGVNRIETEVVVGKQRGAAEKGGIEIEGEKVTVFVNLLRA
ncbi:MAG: hypothetical protein M1820_010409 [Bogoriella megaspora]|nr:MAG: hypothetical protein M1820_010409 [Bogoriella megaspora]